MKNINSKNKPKCKLIGTDDNVFSLIGLVSKALKNAGQAEKVNEFQSKVMACDSYDEALVLMMEYVEVR